MDCTKKTLLIVIALLLPFNVVNSNVLTAEDIVKETTQEVLIRVQEDRDKLELYPEYIEVIVKELIVPHFDFATMSRLVLDKYWRAINDLEQVCFTAGFRNLLVGRYADIFLSYADQYITYEPEKAIGEKDYVSVRQIISHTGIGPFYVDYSMRPEKDGWKVVDLVVDGVSLLKSYHSTYKYNIQQQGLQNFLKDFQECN